MNTKKPQSCKKCRQKFAPDSDELNYNLYEKFNFKTLKDFQKHNGLNKNCPGNKCIKESKKEKKKAPPKWKDYISCGNKNADYEDNRAHVKLWEDSHHREGHKLWFDENKEAAMSILNGILDHGIQFITLVAEPGAGKTAVIHNLIYTILTHSVQIVPQENITILSGMSDNDWYEQTLGALKLRNGQFLNSELHQRNEVYNIVHRSNLNKRIKYLLNNTDKLSNHLFIIDEAHYADEEDMTVDKELIDRLGITLERMKKYNIKILLVSATPDVNASIMSRELNHILVKLENGPGYKGFKFYYDEGMIRDYNDNTDLENLIRSNFSSPRWHFIRALPQQEKGEYRNNLKKICEANGWQFLEDDCTNNYYISHIKNKEHEKANRRGNHIIPTFDPPSEHTLICLKNKYRASKRLKLTKYVGIISEKPGKKMDTTTTCNGLTARFWGYDEVPDFVDNERALFYCNEECIQQYLQLVKCEFANGTEYTSRKLSSTENITCERKTTVYANINNSTNIIVHHKPPTIIKKDTIDEIRAYCDKNLFYDPQKNWKENPEGFYEATKRGITKIYTWDEIENDKREGTSGSGGRCRIHPCYKDKTNKNTLSWWLLVPYNQAMRIPELSI